MLIREKFPTLEKQYGLPEGLLDAVARTESNYNPNAVSPAGAQGLFQFMPKTAKAYGINPFDPEQAAVGAARMYGDLLKQYKGDLPSALAAYNWGSGNLAKKGMENAPEETRNYIAKILPMVNKTALPEGKQYAQAQSIMNDAGSISDGVFDLELPDGTIIEGIPEGTPKSVIAQKLKKAGYELPQEPKVDEPERGLKGVVSAIGEYAGAIPSQLAQGYLWGLSDELEAGLAAPFVAAMRDVPISEAYGMGLEVARNRLAAEQQESPYISTGANVLGAVGSGRALARLGAAAAPNIATKLGGAIARNPIKSGAGLGALSGGVYGFGTGEGDASQRLQSAAGTGAIGAVTGGLGSAVLQGVAGKVAPKVSKIKDRFSGKPSKPDSALAIRNETTQPVVDGAGNVVNISPAEAKFVPQLNVKQGEMFSKTAGQRTQSAELQRLENSALAGNLSPAANQAMKDAISIQDKQFRAAIDKISGGRNVDINVAMDNVVDAVKTAADDAWGGVNNAYAVAKQGGGVKLGSDNIRQGLFKNVAALRRENQFDLSQMPQAKSVVNRLARYAKSTKSGRISSVKLGEMENWRTMATTAANNAQGSEKAFLQGMVRRYDDFMEQTANEAVDLGDAEAIRAFREAVKSRREYGKLYETNKLVDDIVSGGMSPDDVAKNLMGAGSIKGKRQMSKNLDAIIKAGGKESELVKADLQGAFARKMVEKAEGGFLPDNPEMKMLSPAKLKTQLEELFVNQKDFATKLYGKEAVDTAMQAIKELDIIASKQPKVGSSSGSGEVIEGLIRRGGALSRVPFVSEAINSFKKTMGGNKVLGGMQEFSTPEMQIQSEIFKKYVGNVSLGAGATSGAYMSPERQALDVNILPRDNPEYREQLQ